MQFFLPLFSIVATFVLFLCSLLLNELIFTKSEFVRGINWIYLPAGMRLLCLLIFGGWGAIGILLASWVVGFTYYFPEPEHFSRAFVGGIISAVAPYLVYKLAQYQFGLASSLANLTARRLLICILAYAFAGPFFYHLFFVIQGTTDKLLISFMAMFMGDLLGTLIIVYAFKIILFWWAPDRTRSKKI